jgi:TolB-like protein/Tfp pilus assembly protein PilF
MGLSKSRKESLEKAIQFAKKAQALDDSNYIGYIAMAGNYLGERDHENAIKEAKKAINLAPGAAAPYKSLAQALCFSGRSREAIDYYEKGIRIDPFPSPTNYLELGYAYFLTNDYEEAVRVCKKACALMPDNEGCHRTLAAAYGMLGKDTEAQFEVSELLRIMPEWSIEGWKLRQGGAYKNQADVDHFAEGWRRAGLPEKTPLPLPEKPSIAVLPFKNLSGDPKQDYIADGISENIISALSKISEMFVIASNSTFTYKGKPVKVQQVSEELGVRYVLEGSTQKIENRIRITAQLIDATKGHHLWSEKYDRDIKDLFVLQDEITLEIIRAMQVQLTEGEQANVTGKGTKNLDAYLKANQAHEQFYRKNKDGCMKAKELAKEAIVLDPNYAFAYATLAKAHMLDVWLNPSATSEESMRLAVQAVQNALALDDSDPRVYHALTLLYIMQRQYEKAIVSAERQLELSPSGANAYMSMGEALAWADRNSEAIPFIEQAIRLDPYPPAASFNRLGGCYRNVGRYEESITAHKRALQKNPDDMFTHIFLAVTYIKLGREKDAQAEAKEVVRINPKFSLDHFAKSIHDKDQSRAEDFIECLRKAGLPE